MEESTVRKLVELNTTFYESLAGAFSASRLVFPPGYVPLAAFLPAGSLEVLDVGCGNGRFGRFLDERGVVQGYTGVDLSRPLLAEAAVFPGQFLLRDLSRPDCLDGLGVFDLIACLSTLQHVPGRANRERLVRQMAGHLAPGGRIILGNWQFLDSARQRRKIRPWSESDIDPMAVEPGDYLLSWSRGGYGVRYVAYLGEEETLKMATSADLRIVSQFREDGHERALNLYTILAG